MSPVGVVGLIKELESALGVQVVQRSTRKVGLTEVGKSFIRWQTGCCRTSMAHWTIADLKTLKRGLVSGCAAAHGGGRHTGGDGCFVRNTRMDVRLVDCLAEQLTPKLHSGEVDFVVGPERESTPEVDAITAVRDAFRGGVSSRPPLESQAA